LGKRIVGANRKGAPPSEEGGVEELKDPLHCLFWLNQGRGGRASPGKINSKGWPFLELGKIFLRGEAGPYQYGGGKGGRSFIPGLLDASNEKTGPLFRGSVLWSDGGKELET